MNNFRRQEVGFGGNLIPSQGWGSPQIKLINKYARSSAYIYTFRFVAKDLRSEEFACKPPLRLMTRHLKNGVESAQQICRLENNVYLCIKVFELLRLALVNITLIVLTNTAAIAILFCLEFICSMVVILS